LTSDLCDERIALTKLRTENQDEVVLATQAGMPVLCILLDVSEPLWKTRL